LSVRQDDPPLAIDPELIRVITKGHGNDNAGIDWDRDVPALYRVAEQDVSLPLEGMRELYDRTPASKRGVRACVGGDSAGAATMPIRVAAHGTPSVHGSPGAMPH
jgi:hypothetical protein